MTDAVSVPRRPGMRLPWTHQVEQWAVDAVTAIVRREFGWLFYELHGREYGVDALAEVKDSATDPIITGERLALQIKGGDSWFKPSRDGLGWTFRESSDHLAYWLGSTIPVVVVMVRSDGSAAYWQVITPRTVIETGKSFTVVVPASQQFGVAAREQLEAVAARPANPVALFESNLASLPPSAGRHLTDAFSADRLGAARLADRLAIGRFFAKETSASLVERPPPWITGSPAAADLWLAVARYGAEHRGPGAGGEMAAAEAFSAAARASTGERSARARGAAGLLLVSADPDRARSYLDQARAAGQVLLADAGAATLPGEEPDGRSRPIPGSLRDASEEQLDEVPAALIVLGRAAIRTGDPDAAVGYYRRALAAASRTGDATGARLDLADALRRRALTNPDHSARDFDEAVSHARQAIRDRRAWDGPSAEALRVLMDGLLARGDVRGALDSARPSSLGGPAHDRETTAQDVAARAASIALSLGDDDAYEYFLSLLPRIGSGRKILKAAAGSLTVSTRRQVRTWTRLLDDAVKSDDDQAAVICIGALARLGTWPPSADAVVVRALPPDAAATLRATAQVRADGSPEGLATLHHLATRNVIAALELIQVIEDTDGADEAIAECERQARGWTQVQLTLRHIDLLGKHGRDTDAESLAEQIIPNPAYPLEIRQKLCVWRAGRAAESGDFALAAQIARQGLSAGANDEVAWALIGSLMQHGQIPDARAALARHHPDPDTEGRARLWTDLHRGVAVSVAEARTMAAVAKRQPAGRCRDALSGMLQREMTLAAKSGHRWPDDLRADVASIAVPGSPQPASEVSQEREEAHRVAVTSVQIGKQAVEGVALASGLPYAFVLLRRMPGFMPAAELAPKMRDAGEAAARMALAAGTCAVDMSGFYVLANLPAAVRGTIQARIHSLTTAPVMARDVTAARDHLRTIAAARNDASAAADEQLDAQLQDLAERIEADIAEAGKLPPGDPSQSPAGQLISTAAKTGIPLWCDDNALRQRARKADVDTFSIVDLLTVLAPAPANRQAADNYWEHAWQALAAQYITDLPLTPATVIAIARDWLHNGPAHTAIARPAWWMHMAATWETDWLQIATAAAASRSPDAVTQITLAALTGALQAVTPGWRTQRYQRLTAIALVGCHEARHPAPSGFLDAAAQYAGRRIAARPDYVLGELVRQLQQHGAADPVGIAARLLPRMT